MPTDPERWFAPCMIRGAYVFLSDGRVFVCLDGDGVIRPATDVDRHTAVLALQLGPDDVWRALQLGSAESTIVPLSDS